MNSLKISGLVLLLSVVALGCEEVPPNISFEPDAYEGTDTTYVMMDVPVREPKNVLIEDVTGVRCPNCPEAAAVAKAIQDGNPGRVAVMTIHPTSIRTLTFPIKDTFNTDDGEDIFQKLIGGSPQGGLPIGAINRKLFDAETSIAISDKKWTKYANDELAEKSIVNLSAEIVSVVGRTVTLEAKAICTEAYTSSVFMTVALLESHIISPQSSTSGKIDDYEHNHILRDVITPYNGVKLTDEVDQEGRTYERSFIFDIDEDYVLENCHLVVMVNRVDEDNKEVLQVVELDLE